MKVVILAGGFGTRISEESVLRPKPMIEIGDKPILWHIMKHYSEYGYHEFIICLGYKQHMVKEFFADYFLHTSDVTFDLAENRMTVHNKTTEPWKVTLVDTGLYTMTGGRVKRIAQYLDGEPFMLTYGDAVSNVNLAKLAEFHKSHGRMATVTTVNVGQRFGVLEIADGNEITAFREKSEMDGNMINAGFMVCNPEIIDLIEGDATVFESDTLPKVAAAGELMAFKHENFWRCMDNQRDKKQLEEMWASGKAPWKLWED